MFRGLNFFWSHCTDKKPAADELECATTLVYEEAFRVIRLYTEKVCFCAIVSVCSVVFVVVL